MIQQHYPSSPAPEPVTDLLDLIVTDHRHADDAREVERAIYCAAQQADGHINPNHVRRYIPTWVDPHVIGAVYSRLARAKTIVACGWVENTDTRGGNRGKPIRRYRLEATDS